MFYRNSFYQMTPSDEIKPQSNLSMSKYHQLEMCKNVIALQYSNHLYLYTSTCFAYNPHIFKKNRQDFYVLSENRWIINSLWWRVICRSQFSGCLLGFCKDFVFIKIKKRKSVGASSQMFFFVFPKNPNLLHCFLQSATVAQ